MVRKGKSPLRNNPSIIDKERRVLELRMAGATFDRIAESVGYRDRAAAHKAYMRALQRTLTPAAEEIRQLEDARLDRLQTATWRAAMDGDPSAVRASLAIMDRRAKLHGLDHDARMDERRTELVEAQAMMLARGLGWLLSELGLQDDERARDAAATMLRRISGEQLSLTS